MRTTLAVTVIAVLAVGCGSAASAPGASEPPQTALRISYWGGGTGSPPGRWTLRCDPVGGSLPRAAEACRRLRAMRLPFAPPRTDLMCTQVYGGPQQAEITGAYRGRRVLVRLAMNDGCQIARFQRLGFLIPGFSSRGPGA